MDSNVSLDGSNNFRCLSSDLIAAIPEACASAPIKTQRNQGMHDVGVNNSPDAHTVGPACRTHRDACEEQKGLVRSHGTQTAGAASRRHRNVGEEQKGLVRFCHTKLVAPNQADCIRNQPRDGACVLVVPSQHAPHIHCNRKRFVSSPNGGTGKRSAGSAETLHVEPLPRILHLQVSNASNMSPWQPVTSLQRMCADRGLLLKKKLAKSDSGCCDVYKAVYVTDAIYKHDQITWRYVHAADKTCLSATVLKYLQQQLQAHLHVNTFNNVARIEDLIETPDCLVWVTEQPSGGSLREYFGLDSHSWLSEVTSRKLFKHLVNLAWSCHQQQVLLRHLNWENVGWDSERGLLASEFIFDGCEWMLSELKTEGCSQTPSSPQAPELNSKATLDQEKITVWNLGIILHVLLTGKLPRERAQGGKTHIMLTLSSSASTAVRRLLHRMLQSQPSHRYSLDNVLLHAWLVNDPLQAPPEPMSVTSSDYPFTVPVTSTQSTTSVEAKQPGGGFPARELPVDNQYCKKWINSLPPSSTWRDQNAAAKQQKRCSCIEACYHVCSGS